MAAAHSPYFWKRREAFERARYWVVGWALEHGSTALLWSCKAGYLGCSCGRLLPGCVSIPPICVSAYMPGLYTLCVGQG
jgi:hypothetical protein